MEQNGLTRWGVDELAVLYTLLVCTDYGTPPAGVI